MCSELAFVLTHELAHAWEAANLTDADRTRYVDVRGLASWNDPADSWKDRGVEDAAFMIQQNLMVSTPSMASPTWIERVTADELLTGHPASTREVQRAASQRTGATSVRKHPHEITYGGSRIAPQCGSTAVHGNH